MERVHQIQQAQAISPATGLRRVQHNELEVACLDSEKSIYEENGLIGPGNGMIDAEGQKHQMWGICDVLLSNVKGVLERIGKIVRWTEQGNSADCVDILNEYQQRVWPVLIEVDSQIKILSQTVRHTIDACSINERKLEWLLAIHKFQVAIEQAINALTGDINDDIERVLCLKVRGGGLIGLHLKKETVEQIQAMQKDVRSKNFRA